MFYRYLVVHASTEETKSLFQLSFYTAPATITRLSFTAWIQHYDHSDCLLFVKDMPLPFTAMWKALLWTALSWAIWSNGFLCSLPISPNLSVIKDKVLNCPQLQTSSQYALLLRPQATWKETIFYCLVSSSLDPWGQSSNMVWQAPC